MEESNWKEIVLLSLEQRDAREPLSSDIYEACKLRFRSPCSCPDLKLATSYATLRAEGCAGIPFPTSLTPQTYSSISCHVIPLVNEHDVDYSDELGSLKAQVAGFYKTQNTNLQTIKSLETNLTSLQQEEKQLRKEFNNQFSMLILSRISDLRTRRKDLELRAALHGEELREKNQQIQVIL
jgi:hypothetical protein